MSIAWFAHRNDLIRQTRERGFSREETCEIMAGLGYNVSPLVVTQVTRKAWRKGKNRHYAPASGKGGSPRNVLRYLGEKVDCRTLA